MIEADQYMATVKSYFNFLITEFNFKISEEKINGNVFYDVKYNDSKRVVSISYENIADYLLVIIFLLQNGQLPAYDDKTKILHLNSLTNLTFSKLSKDDITLNDNFFSKFEVVNELERKLLKSAKELRLCLKYYVSSDLETK